MNFKRLMHIEGKLVGVVLVESDGETVLSPNGKGWQDFLDWNAKQAVPLDLSDHAPDPVPLDVELNRIKEIVSKQDQDITAAERWEAVFKFMRRQIRD